MKIISWNVNGINACCRKGLIEFINKEKADVYCFQELKASDEKIPQEIHDLTYNSYYLMAEKKGYSGVSIHTKQKPLSVIKGIGNEQFDREGRVLAVEFKDFFLVNAYFPHSQRELARLGFKLDFNNEFSKFVLGLEKKKPVIIASDFNVAHKEIDLANPKQNKKNAGFTEEERSWFDDFLKNKYIDSFREFEKEGGHYTWWSYRNNLRERNIGWRIDYFVLSHNLKNQLKESKILSHVHGSDHCPILLGVSTKL